MENQAIDIAEEEIKTIHLTPESVVYLKEIQRWTKFISIVGFVMVGFIFLMAFSASALFSFINEIGPDLPAEAYQIGTATGIIFFFIYGGIGLIYFFPIYYLYKFSHNLKKSLELSDEIKLMDAFRFLKSHYKFIGILIIIGLISYAITFLVWGLIIFAFGIGSITQ